MWHIALHTFEYTCSFVFAPDNIGINMFFVGFLCLCISYDFLCKNLDVVIIFMFFTFGFSPAA